MLFTVPVAADSTLNIGTVDFESGDLHLGTPVLSCTIPDLQLDFPFFHSKLSMLAESKYLVFHVSNIVRFPKWRPSLGEQVSSGIEGDNVTVEWRNEVDELSADLRVPGDLLEKE